MAEHGCVSAEKGWQAVAEARGLYLKNHSWGEFVFDFAWANAYAQQGLNYYPKLVSCVPFTPVAGPRLLLAPEQLQEIAQQHDCSSAHALFCMPSEAEELAQANWLRREDLRFVWRNQGYRDFADFLAALSQKKAKNIRRERRRVAEAHVEIEWLAADQLPASDWPKLFQLYASTYAMRGQEPYLNMPCLKAWASNFGERLQFCLARHADELIAMAFFFIDGDTLYGRHWGAAADFHSLHFELCYYQGIEYAIAQRLSCFDAGVQGGHKLARGFDPEISVSMHWIADPRFRAAIARWLAHERDAVGEQCTAIDEHSAYKASRRALAL
jgi:predicted N-acyltransferase